MRVLMVLALAATVLAGCTGDNDADDSRLPPTDDVPAQPAPTHVWADLASATIRPGVQMSSESGQCTSNFVFTTPHNASVYLGFAAHCVGTGAANATNGCDPETGPLPLGTSVDIEGATQPGRLVYSSWTTMQAVGESDGPTCQYNDFAIVEVAAEDAALVNPAVLEFGGPTGLADASNVTQGDRVVSYGNSGIRPDQGGAAVDRKEGYVVQTHSSGWTHTVYTLSPGVPGDSGSNMLVAETGEALGVVVTVAILPLTGSNGITNLANALAYANEHSGYTFELATADLLDGGVLP